MTTDLASATANGVISSIDILVPIINAMDGAPQDTPNSNQRSSYAPFLQGPNALLWMYQSCEPSSSCTNGSVGGETGWPALFIDASALANRIMPWMDFKYQVTAELYYDTTMAMESFGAPGLAEPVRVRQQRRWLALLPGQAVAHRRHP